MEFIKLGRISDHGLSEKIYGVSSFCGIKEAYSWTAKCFLILQLIGLTGKMMI